MASHERSFSPPKTCPNPDKGSRLATTPQSSFEPTAQITFGALSVKHSLGVKVEGRKNDNFQHRITTHNQKLVPAAHKPARQPILDGSNGSRFGGTSEKTRSKQRKKERKHLQQVKGYI